MTLVTTAAVTIAIASPQWRQRPLPCQPEVIQQISHDLFLGHELFQLFPMWSTRCQCSNLSLKLTDDQSSTPPVDTGKVGVESLLITQYAPHPIFAGGIAAANTGVVVFSKADTRAAAAVSAVLLVI